MAGFRTGEDEDTAERRLFRLEKCPRGNRGNGVFLFSNPSGVANFIEVEPGIRLSSHNAESPCDGFELRLIQYNRRFAWQDWLTQLSRYNLAVDPRRELEYVFVCFAYWHHPISLCLEFVFASSTPWWPSVFEYLISNTNCFFHTLDILPFTFVMSIQSCPVSGMAGSQCPVGSVSGHSRPSSRMGPRGCSFSGYCQPGDIHAAFDASYLGYLSVRDSELTIDRSLEESMLRNGCG